MKNEAGKSGTSSQNGLRPVGEEKAGDKQRGDISVAPKNVASCCCFSSADCLSSNPYAATHYIVIMDKLFKLQIPQFRHLQNGHEDTTFVIRFMCGSVCVK